MTFGELLDSVLGFIASVIVLSILGGTIAILFFAYTEVMIKLTVVILIMIGIHMYGKSKSREEGK